MHNVQLKFFLFPDIIYSINTQEENEKFINNHAIVYIFIILNKDKNTISRKRKIDIINLPCIRKIR